MTRISVLAVVDCLSLVLHLALAGKEGPPLLLSRSETTDSDVDSYSLLQTTRFASSSDARADGRYASRKNHGTLSLKPGAAAIADGNHSIEYDGMIRRYEILKPAGFVSGESRDVLLGFHSFGGSSQEIIRHFGILTELQDGPILVAFQGVSAEHLPPGFNGAGSSVGVGPKGETCSSTAITYSCHASCAGACHRCAWTSCADDVGFAMAVLDLVEASLGQQPRRVFATGFSGGAQFIFELASDPRSASRLDAVAPLHGLPNRGFLRHAPPGASPRLLGIWGGFNSSFQDMAYPPFTTNGQDPDTSLDSLFGRMAGTHGWYYSTARNTTEFWAHHVDCAAQSSDSDQVPQTSHKDLSCTAFCGGRVVECLRATLEHDYAFYYPSVVWDFFSSRTIG